MGKTKKNIVFCAQSLDGFLAGPNGEIDWLDEIPNTDKSDMNYLSLMEEIDAIIMGRKSFEKVCSFDIDWPYTKPVVVLSNTMTTVPKPYQDKIIVQKGSVEEILKALHHLGFYSLYIDGGLTVQKFLVANAIDELRITTIPVLLGSGIPLFKELSNRMWFEHVRTEVFSGQYIQSCFKRKSGLNR